MGSISAIDNAIFCPCYFVTCHWLDFFAPFALPFLQFFNTDVTSFSDLYSLFPGPAVEYDGHTCRGVPSAPPMLGQHTTEILTDVLQYSDEEIHNLEQDGVIESYLKN